MYFYSTNDHSHRVCFREAVLNGIAPDGGLYLPSEIPSLKKTFLESLTQPNFQQISFDIAELFVDHISADDLQTIVEQTITFDTPLKQVGEDVYVLELFHGPTLAFKDFGARFLANIMAYYNRKEEKEIIILVATSGDTGSAVAHGFYEKTGIKIGLLYPSGMVSTIQEQQLTTMGKNIFSFEVKGTFDDCQKLVKTAFQDSELRQKYTLSSANSINIARLLPQSFYYFNALSKLKKYDHPVTFSVPSGNFGNLTAGIIANRMGLPVDKFIAAVNQNDVFPKYLSSGQYEAKTAEKTLSSAMDVGDPSNFARIADLFGKDTKLMRNKINSYSISDEQTRAVMKNVYSTYRYIIDPHGAVGYSALSINDQNVGRRGPGIVLETAHPAKFADIVSDVLDLSIDIPERLQKCLNKPKSAELVSNDFQEFKQQLIAKMN